MYSRQNKIQKQENTKFKYLQKLSDQTNFLKRVILWLRINYIIKLNSICHLLT